MTIFKLTTPIIFIVFNRPHETQRVFEEIRKARPTKLLVISDGPRPERVRETIAVTRTRAIVENIDWPCEVLKEYSSVNLGCKKRIASGLNWAFGNVSEAIILEDDCLPEPTFFQFCQEMLNYYRDDERIGMIGGSNFLPSGAIKDQSYYFTKYSHIWGWATWASRWNKSYDVGMTSLPGADLSKFCRNDAELKYWSKIFNRVFRGEVDTWDYQWTYANWMASRINILPAKNLISNIGFGENATHTNSYSKLANLPTNAIAFPLTHPKLIAVDQGADEYSDVNQIRLSLFRRLLNKFIWILRKLSSR